VIQKKLRRVARITPRRRGLCGASTLFFAIAALTTFVAGCSHGNDGRKAFLKSEVAVNKVQSFRAKIDIYGYFAVHTDAEYDCSRSVAHYIDNNPRLNRKIEYIQTPSITFSRAAGTERWNAVRQPAGLSVCERLRNGASIPHGSPRLFTGDQGRIVPPFFYYANEPTGASGATITPMGNEVVDGDYCDVWKIHDNDSAFPLHTIWIAVEDGLPRKYLEGEPDNPQGLVTYSDYNTKIPIEVPPDPFAR
jgi:hypothetical protein